MKHIFQTIQHTARAATVLLLALLAAQTAGAQGDIRQVSNAPDFAEAFDNPNVSVINVTDNITGFGACSLDHALTINLNGHTISGDYLHIEVDPDGSLTINGGGQGGSVGNIIRGYAYGPAIDNDGTVTLSHVNITTNYNFAILGGTLNIGNNVSFNGWTDRPFNTPNVNIEDGNYSSTVVATVTVGGKTHYFENLSVALDYFANNPGNDGFSLCGIKTAADWGYFCDMLEAGETFSGKTIVLAGDIGTPEDPVTRMGSSTTQFQGTFNGQGHTLTVQYGTASEPVNQQFVAPFPNVTGGATFRNLTIAGSIYSGYDTSDDKGTGGLIGHLFGSVTVEHCVSTVTVNAASDRAGGFVGLCEHAVTFTDCVSSATVTCTGSGSGFVGWSRNGEHTIAFYGCLFSGKVLKQGNVGSGNGSFVGWKGFTKTVKITNCIAAPAADENMATDNSATFCRYSASQDNGETHITNCYYTQTLGNAQGKARHTIAAGTDVTVAHAGVATHYATSGITAYKATGASADSDLFIAGLLYNNNVVDVLYAGIDDVVSLTLSNTAPGDVPDGYQYGYTTNAGTLEGSTLTMPAADVTISVNTDVLTVLPWSGDGSKSSPYLIEYPSQLDLLAYRVNGTHGETCQEDGYYNTYFQLSKDISYPHKADGEAGAATESNYEAIGCYYGGGYRYFSGHFNGNSKTISGIRIYKGGSSDADRCQGIFGQTYGADIHDLTLADARITGYTYTGGIVGYKESSTVTRCHVAADVAVCAVQSDAWYHGGISGNNRGGTIEQCTSAATLTTADANNSKYYGGIAGINDKGTLRDNLAIGATVPAAANNSYGAITGNNNSRVKHNYYAACKVAGTENATGVGCGYIDDGNGGRIVADVTANNGAVSIHTLTLADGITTSTPVTITIGTTGYYAQGTAIALSNSGTPGNIPLGYQYGFTASAGTLSGSTLTMPDQDVTVSVNTAILTVLPWGGDGTESSPYIIEYRSQLDLLAHRVNGTHGETCQEDGYYDTYFQLANDISYPHKADGEEGADAESNYEAIGGYYGDGYRSFSGHFDGNNNTISGIRIYKNGTGNVNSYQGIFGRTDGADIHHLTLADARITGHDFTGGIVGYNEGGTVTHCHVAADVAVCAVQYNALYHGGIVGYNLGTIEQCTSAATLTIADADNSYCYGGIAGYNSSYGTLSDNLAIGATVPAAADNSYGAITGDNRGTLQRNYYTACKVADTENATGVGCGHIGNDDDGYTTADVNNVNNPDGARAVFALTLADGITTSTAAIVTHAGTGYYAQGTAIALSYSGTPGNIPLGYQYEDGDGFTASAGTLEGSTLTMPAADVTVSLALRSTGKLVEVSYVDAGGTPQTAQAIALDGTEPELGSTETDLASYDEETWYFVGRHTVAFDHTLHLSGDVHLILADGCTMNVTSSDDNGIDVNGSLTIYGQTDGTGTLNATGHFAGIYTDGGTITISGGTVTATSDSGDGISTYSGNITISGGRVTATGNYGDGISTYSGTITISGGRVTVTGDNTGIFTDSGTITISGGRVTATGAPGIYTDRGTITISGGRVTATGAPGIYTDRGTITLGCTTASDFIYASSYYVGSEGSLNIADGQMLFDEDGNPYRDNGVTIPDGKTLRLYGIDLAARQAPDGNYWTTYYNGALGFTIDADEHACAYTATYGAGQLTLHNLGKEIPAGTAVIIVADNDVVSMTAAFLPAYSGPTNDLRGVDVDTQTSSLGTGTFYVLGMTTVNDEKHFGFHRYTGEEMAAHKAYVLVSGSQALARSLTMVFDDATGIESLTPDAAPQSSAADHWFTLDGRRLQAKPTAPGIYVNNGKKVVIK